MAVTIVADVMNGVTDAINDGISTNVAAVIQAVSPFFFVCLALYVVYMVFKYMYEPPDIPIMDVIKNVAALGVVTMLAFNAGNFMKYIVPFVLGTGDDIASAISGSSSVASQLDKFIDTFVEFINQQWDGLKFAMIDPRPFFYGILTILVVLIGMIPFVVISFAYLMMAKIMVSLLLSVGPIFIAFAFYPSTRSNFQQWTAQCLNYIILVILYSVAFSLEMTLINKYAALDPNVINFERCLILAVVLLAFVGVTREIPSLASQLAGGVGISGLAGGVATGGLGVAAGALGGGALAWKLGQGRNAAAGWAAGKIGSGAKGAWNRLRGNGEIKP